MEGKLPPPPDFRYVGLEAAPRGWGLGAGTVAGAFAALGAGSALLSGGASGRGLLLSALGAVTTALVVGLGTSGPSALRRHARRGGSAVPMAIVPWGVLVEPDEVPRVLRWAAVRSVQVDMIHGRDQATPTTLWSLVTVETERERLAARAPGAVPIDRLMVHLEAYADEAAHGVALDLDGERRAFGPYEPDVEPLLGAARAWLESSEASSRLDLPPVGYRRTGGATAVGPRGVELLRGILRDRTPKPVDPRPFAAVVAAELGVRALAADLVTLVQSPHALLAAVAKSAARRLGEGIVKVGTVDEVAPFLPERDVQALAAWSA